MRSIHPPHRPCSSMEASSSELVPVNTLQPEHLHQWTWVHDRRSKGNNSCDLLQQRTGPSQVPVVLWQRYKLPIVRPHASQLSAKVLRAAAAAYTWTLPCAFVTVLLTVCEPFYCP